MFFSWLSKQINRDQRCGARGTRTIRKNTIRLLLELLEDRTVPTTFTWQGATGGLWTTPANWGQPTAPTTGSDVIINNGTVPDYNTSVELNTLNVGSTSGLALNGGSLILDGTSTLNGAISNSISVVAEGAATLAGTTTWIGGQFDTGGAGTWTNTGALTIPNNSTGTTSGIFNNEGTFALNSVGNTTTLFTGGTFDNTGGGVITMSNNVNNRILGTGGVGLINDTGSTISGAGQLGASVNGLAINNKGTIDANVSSGLFVSSSATMTNTGTLEATAGAPLGVALTVTNTGGTIQATGSGSVVGLNGATIDGGTLTTTSGGVIDTGGSTLNGVTISTGSTVTAQNNTTTILQGTITNNGTILENSVGNGTAIEIDGAVSLTGGGTVTMSNNPNNEIISKSNIASDKLTNVDNTIQGAGQIGINLLTLVNQGTIDANQSNTLTVNPGGGVTNTATLEASAGGTMALSATVANTGGSILSNGVGSTVDLNGSTITGGTLTTTTSGAILSGGSTLDGVTISTGSTVTAENNTATTLKDTLTNNGTLAIASTGNLTDVVISGTVTHTGGGSITMSNTIANRIRSTSGGGDTLINDTANTIQGTGEIGAATSLTFNNKGTVDATGSTALVVAPTVPMTNSGTLEATAGGALELVDTVNNTGATIQSTGTNSIVFLNGAIINGGTLTTTTGGVIQNNGTATLNGITISSNSTLALDNATATTLQGTITNNGTIFQDSVGNLTDIDIDGAVSLTGGGTLTMSNTTANRILSKNGLTSDTLTNVNNTIQGAGQIGVNQLALVNQATIDANDSASLTINPGGGVTNTATLEATAGGTMALSAIVTNTGGTILSTGAGATVDLSGSTINGGTLTTASGGVMDSGGSTLNGVTISTGSTVTAENNTSTTLAGALTNNGTLFIDSVGNVTDVVISGTVTNTGGGAITMSNTTANRIIGTGTLINDTNNTIQGAGQIGAGQALTLNNKGTIDANISNSLTISPTLPVTNSGTLEATAGGTLGLPATVNNTATGLIVSTDLGSFINLNGIDVNGGTLTTNKLNTTTPGIIENNGTTILNGVTISTGSTLTLLNTSSTTLHGTIKNQGTIAETSVGNLTDIDIDGAVSLTGGGTLAMSNTTANRIRSLNGAATDVLTNVDNTIQGAGQIGAGTLLTLVNQATIDANVSNILTIAAGGGVTNTSLIDASAGGQLSLASVVANTGGTILSTGSSSVANLSGSTITGGTLTTSSGGSMLSGSSTLSGVTISSGSTVTVENNTATVLVGTITNHGTIAESSVGNTTDIDINGAVSLTGGGTLTMSNTTANRIISLNGVVTDVLTNVDNTIQGAGQIGAGLLKLINQATIDANQTNLLTINPSSATNTATIEASAAGQLHIATSVNNAGGTILSTGAGSVVDLSASTITGGTLSTASPAVMDVGGSTLTGVTIGSGSTITVENNTATTLVGTITNHGTIAESSVGNTTDIFINGAVSLTGGGTLTMSNTTANRIDSLNAAATDVLTNVDNTIQGAGQIGVNGLKLINQATIDANQSSLLTINPSSAINTATIEASAGGQLHVDTSVNNAGGTILSTGAGSVVDLSGATVTGGTLTTASGGTMFSGGSTLDTLTISAGSTVTAQNNTITFIKGTITNNGTIFEDSVGNVTVIQLIGDVTLSGTGTLTMSATLANRIIGTNGPEILTNGAGHTIQGTGQISNLTNSGTLAPGVNSGTLAAGEIQITGNYTQTSTGNFAVKLGGTTGPGSNYDQLTVAGTAALDGNISVSLFNGYTPALNDLIKDVIDFASKTGDFATHNGFAQAGNLTFQEQFDPAVNPVRLNLLVVQQTVHLVSIAVTPSNPSIAKGLTQQFTATGTFSDSSTQDLTNSVTWVSATTSVATINAAGLATAVNVGTSTISATENSVSGSTTLTVTAAVLESIAVTPANPSIAKGLTQQFTATGTFSDNSTQNLTSTATWASATPSVATINATGLASRRGSRHLDHLRDGWLRLRLHGAHRDGGGVAIDRRHAS